MKLEKTSKNVAYTGLFAGLAASSCCIFPLIALIAGIGGSASALAWIEPFRIYLIGLAVIAITYAWYNYLKHEKTDDCVCEPGNKPKWYQTKKFLIGISLFVAVSLSFPYYAHIFYLDNKKEVAVLNKSYIQILNINVEGMTCASCEEHIKHAVNDLEGIINIDASYENAIAQVKFDNSKISKEEIEKAINATGYKVSGSENKYKTVRIGENDNTSYYEVGLVCNAAPNIGCGSRSKPVLLALNRQDEIKEAKLNKEGTIISIDWEDNVSINTRHLIADKIYKSNKVDVNEINGTKISSKIWLNSNDVDRLSLEEASIIANQLIATYKKKRELTEIQENNLRNDIENIFYDFFLNYETLGQLSDSNEYRKLMQKITETSQAYIKVSDIPDLDSLLNSCYRHAENCNKSSCCSS